MKNIGLSTNVKRGKKPMWYQEGDWDGMLEKLKLFKYKYGTYNVPRQSKAVQEEFGELGKWVHAMRERLQAH